MYDKGVQNKIFILQFQMHSRFLSLNYTANNMNKHVKNPSNPETFLIRTFFPGPDEFGLDRFHCNCVLYRIYMVLGCIFYRIVLFYVILHIIEFRVYFIRLFTHDTYIHVQ
jgi:hypothetical protein